MEEKDYTVSEAVQQIGVPSHVLRYWEEELQIPVGRTSQGHRFYSKKEIALFCKVKEWKDSGIQLKAIRVLLEYQMQDLVGGQEGEREECEMQRIVDVIEEKASAAYSEDVPDNETVEYPISLVRTEQKDLLNEFQNILQNLITEVVEEQNKKQSERLERMFSEVMRDELSQMYAQFYRDAVREAAAETTQESFIERIIHRWLKRARKKEL